MNKDDREIPSSETTEQKYNRLLGDGSDASLRAMVLEGTEDWKAGRVYTTEELIARLALKSKGNS